MNDPYFGQGYNDVEWIVTTRNGVRYTFYGKVRKVGDNLVYDNPMSFYWGCEHQGTPPNDVWRKLEWERIPLTRVEDANLNRIDYTWDYEENIGTSLMPYDCHPAIPGMQRHIRALQLKQISYNTGRVLVALNYGTRADRPNGYLDGNTWHFFTEQRLTSVDVKILPNQQTTPTILHSYVLTHADQGNPSNPSQILLNLLAITERRGGQDLTTTFDYSGYDATWPCSHQYLNKVDNPFRGVVHFQADIHTPPYLGDPPSAYACWDSDANWRPPSVTQRSEDDIPSGAPTVIWSYNSSGWSDQAHGFAKVWVALPDSAACEIHDFEQMSTINGQSRDHLAGREKQLTQCVACGGAGECTGQLTSNATTWSHSSANLPLPDYSSVAEEDKPRFVYVSEQRAYATQFADNGTAITSAVPVKRTTYEYQLERQGGVQYGNLTRVTEYNGHNGGFDATPLRTASTWYYPNATTWIINKPALIKFYIGAETTLFAETHNYYDNTTNYAFAPTAGLLRRVETMSVLNGSYQGNPASISQYYGYENGNLKWMQDARGNQTTYFYDAWFQAFRVCEQNAAGHKTQTTYYGVPGDGTCNTTNGSTTTLAGRFGQPEKSWDANAALTEYEYDDLGRPLKVAVAPNTLSAPTWWYHYRPLNEVGPGQPFWVHTLQRDEQATNNNYLHTWTFYDGFGRVLQTQGEAERDAANNAQHVETSYTYTWRDAVARASVPRFISGDVARSPDSGPPWPTYTALDETAWAGLTKTVYAYDLLGRRTQTTHPDTTTTRQYYNIGFDEGYNTTRRLHAVIDARNVQTIRADDSFGRLSRTKQFSATDYTTPRWGDTPYAVAIYRYNIGDQLTDAYDPANNRIQVFYDGLGRKASLTDPDLGAWSYAYDAAGNLQTQTDARGTTLWFGYDTLNRLTQKRLSSSGGTLLAEYKYDETGYGYSTGRRTRALAYVSGAPNNTIQWTYDMRGRVTSDIHTIDSVDYTTGYTYDAADRVRTLTYPDGSEVVTTNYTARGLPDSLASPQATYVFSTTYDALGRLELRAYQSAGLQRDYLYYAWNAGAGYGGRLQSLYSGVGSGASGLQKLTYAYDATGNLTRLRDDNNSGQRQCFSYDPLGRLTGARIGDANCAPTTGGNGYYSPEDYSYAANGNLASKAGVNYTYPAAAPATGCAANTPTTKPHAVAAITSYSFTYDCNGNLLTRPEATGTYTQAYDAENRLQSVTAGGLTTSYAYDADSTLVKKVQGGQTTVYVGKHFEKNLTSGQATSYYDLGGQRVAVRKAGTLYYLLTDHLGSTAVVTNQGGGVVAQQLYKPWGESRWSSGTLPTDRKFTGQRSEEASLGSLYDYGARAYSPRLGRFLSPDTIVPNPGNPQALNRYSYVLGNPLRHTDPTGHDVACPGYDAGACRSGSPRSRNYRTRYGDDTFDLDDIPHYTGQNPFDKTVKVSKAAYQAALDYGVPPQIVAAILQLENNPNVPLAGVRRSSKQAATPLLQALDPDHDLGKGWSLGPGNVKPGTAAGVKWHFAVYYPDKDLAQQSGIGKQDFVSKLTDPETNARFVAGYTREAIDAVYEPGYEGPMSEMGLALVINYYNTGNPDIDALRYGYGRAGVSLLRAANEGASPLIFYTQP